MTNEEFQRIVLEKLSNLESDVGGLKTDVGSLKSDLGSLKEGQKGIRKELRFVWDDLKRIDRRLEKQESKIKQVLP